MKTAAKVRNEVLHGFDDLIPILSDVELYLGTFPGDEAIRKVATSLTVAIIDAVERSIGFFISSEGKCKTSSGSLHYVRGRNDARLRKLCSNQRHQVALVQRQL